MERTSGHSYLPLIVYNYALYLASENRWEAALEITALGRRACITRGNYCMLPGFLHIEAEGYYSMGEINKSKELYRSAYHIYGAIMDTKNQKAVANDANERFSRPL